MTDLTKRYCDMERRLFEEEYRAATELEKWKDSPVVAYHASPLALLDEPVQSSLLTIGSSTDAERDLKRLKK
jgi:hypothetical protein